MYLKPKSKEEIVKNIIKNDYKDGKLIKFNNKIDEYFYVIKSIRKGQVVYDFIESGISNKFIKDNYPIKYIYTIDKGNVYLDHINNYAKQELRSNSAAFNKGDPAKMASPNDLKGTANFILNHFLRKSKLIKK